MFRQIYETFGPTSQPLYQVRFNDSFPLDPEKVLVSREVFHVPLRSNFVFLREIKRLKGSDASNVHDEEPAEDELEFSDDEAEAAHRQRMKKKYTFYWTYRADLLTVQLGADPHAHSRSNLPQSHLNRTNKIYLTNLHMVGLHSMLMVHMMPTTVLPHRDRLPCLMMIPIRTSTVAQPQPQPRSQCRWSLLRTQSIAKSRVPVLRKEAGLEVASSVATQGAEVVVEVREDGEGEVRIGRDSHP